MAKNRYIDTKFWDDNYITELDPIEKLLYLYFLTNTLTNISGIYEIPLRRISFDTGIDKDMILKIIERFSSDKKIFYVDGWLIICNFPKHQQYNKSPKIKLGIEACINDIPDEIKEKIDTLSIPYTYSLNYSNYNSNTNSNININSKSSKMTDINSNSKSPAVDEDFKTFWDAYQKKTGKDKCIKKWKKLNKDEKKKILEVIPKYVESTPDKYFRKNPLTYLNGRYWEDEENPIDQDKIERDLIKQDLMNGVDNLVAGDRSAKRLGIKFAEAMELNKDLLT